MKIELVTEPMPAGLPGIVPVLLTLEGDTLRAECYEAVAPTVEAHLRAYGERVFSDRSLRALFAAVAPFIEETGYEPDAYGLSRYYESYRLDENCAPLPDGAILPGTALLTKKLSALPNRTTMDTGLLLARKAPCAVHIEGGQVVAVCAVNDFAEGEAPEVTVETAVGFRRQGYGRSVVAALAGELRRRRYPVCYCCSRYNHPSKRLARSLGFRRVGRFYAIAGYR